MTVRFLTNTMSLAMAPPVGHSEVFLSLEQAQRLIFPGETFLDVSFVLSERQRRTIESASGVKVKDKKVQAWRTGSGGIFFLDRVIGKHDQIVFACGITSHGLVKQLEVLEHRESYGKEVRQTSWRSQFVGKSAASPLELQSDIRNISGATLSCSHITEGVRRLLHTFAVAFPAEKL